MKKILAVALLALAGTIGAQAQSGNRHYRVEAGVGLSSISASTEVSVMGVNVTAKSKSDASFAARLAGAVEFVLSGNQKGEFYLAPGLEYRYTSYKGEGGGETSSINRLSVPVSAGYRFMLGGGNAISLEGGVFAACGLFGSEGTYGSEGGFERFELGLQGSAAYEFSRYSVRLGANYGLTDIAKSSVGSAHTSDFFVSFGVRF